MPTFTANNPYQGKLYIAAENWQRGYDGAAFVGNRNTGARGYYLQGSQDAHNEKKVVEDRDAKRRAERIERLIRAAKVYTFNYLQDEHEEPELCTCGPKQHAELVELFAALEAAAKGVKP